jgi:acetoin utilization deacetylase AcuC-like enzyme
MKIVYHEDYLKQTQYAGHPECPERLASIMKLMYAEGIDGKTIAPEPAPADDVGKVHSKEYMELLKHFGRGRLDADTSVYPHTYEMAMLAAGGGLAAVQNMLDRREPTFALLRPPGHHATRNNGMGFCYFNNVAIAAERLRRKLDRVAIVDIDVHHGNGTNDAFLERNDVLYISTHQWGIYPGTGTAKQVGASEGVGYTVNIPMGAHCGDATFAAARDKLILPILKQYKPDAILVSLGGDAHYMDPLSSLTLSSRGYLDLVAALAEAAGELCEGRWAVFLEGGYNVAALADTVVSCMGMASGQPRPTEFNEVSDAELVGVEWLDEALAVQRKHWDL